MTFSRLAGAKFPTHNSLKDQKEPRGSRLSDRTPREPRDALPDAVARWRSELTLTALRLPRRGAGWGRRTCAPPARVFRGPGSFCTPTRPEQEGGGPAQA